MFKATFDTCKKIIKEYFHSAFVWLGISFLILKNLEGIFYPVREFRELLWVNDLNWVFVIPTLFISMAINIVPFRSGLLQMLNDNKNKRYAIFFFALLIMVPFCEMVYYRIEIVTIIGQQHEEVIIDETRFKEIENFLLLSIFFIIPGLDIFIQYLMTKSFVKRHLQLDHIRWSRLVSVSWIMFILLLIGFWIVNIHIFHRLS